MLDRTIKIFSAIILTLMLAAYLFVPAQTVEISQDQISQSVSEHLPVHLDKRLLKVTVENATIDLADNGGIRLDAVFSAKALSLEGQGTAKINTAIRFESGQFYLTDMRHDDIAFVYSDESSEKLETFGAAIERRLRESLADATESGDPDRITGAATANAYYETQLRNDAIAVLDDILKDLPVYDLRKAGGMVYLAGLALDDFRVSADGIAVHLSAQKLIQNLAIFVLPILALLSFVVGPFMQRAINESGNVKPST